MKKCIRILALLLLMAIVLAGCEGKNETSDPTDETETSGYTGKNEILRILSGGQYKVIRHVGVKGAAVDAAVDVRMALSTVLDYTPEITDDFAKSGTDPDSIYDFEILVGKTNRSALSDDISNLGFSEYRIAAVGNRIVIAGGSDSAISLAAEKFIELLAEEEVSLPIIYPGAGEGEGEGEGETTVKLKVGTFNIKHGQVVGLDYTVIASDILAAGLDVCGLQEVDNVTTRNNKQETMKIIAEATGYPYYQFSKSINFQGGGYGTGILSKYPIVSYETVLLESDGNEQRSYGHAVIDVNGTQIDFYNTHLSYESKDTRTKQFKALATALAKKELWVLTGDFNTDDFTEFKVFGNPVLVNSASTRMSSCGGSAIDNIVCPAGTTVVSYGKDSKVTHSDHYMVWANLIIG